MSPATLYISCLFLTTSDERLFFLWDASALTECTRRQPVRVCLASGSCFSGDFGQSCLMTMRCDPGSPLVCVCVCVAKAWPANHCYVERQGGVFVCVCTTM